MWELVSHTDVNQEYITTLLKDMDPSHVYMNWKAKKHQRGCLLWLMNQRMEVNDIFVADEDQPLRLMCTSHNVQKWDGSWALISSNLW